MGAEKVVTQKNHPNIRHRCHQLSMHSLHLATPASIHLLENPAEEP